LPTRFREYIAGLRSDPPTSRVGLYPGLRSTPWHDPQEFRLARDLEAAADEIAAEARALTGTGFLDEPEGQLVRSGRWSYLPLYVGGQKKLNNCARCPRTVAVIDANRAALSAGGIVLLSVLDSETSVAPHEGLTNMTMRCHLGVDVPEGCGLRVGGITRTWEQGRCLVFDDSFTHEVWNRSSRRRIVLIVDVWHPDLTDDEVALLNALHLPPIYTPNDFEP
jgi:aspartyl/asparaginyl beta-hydroxylase (cupin superfamily)